MLSHPPGQRSARSGSPSDSKEIGKKFLDRAAVRHSIPRIVSATARVPGTATHFADLFENGGCGYLAAEEYRQSPITKTKNPLSMAGLRQNLALQQNRARAKGLEPST